MSAANDRTDKCGNPNPDVCLPQQIRTPICYLTPILQDQGVQCGLPGFLVVDVDEDCSGTFVEIQDRDGDPVPNAFQVPCPPGGSFGVGGFGS